MKKKKNDRTKPKITLELPNKDKSHKNTILSLFTFL